MVAAMRPGTAKWRLLGAGSAQVGNKECLAEEGGKRREAVYAMVQKETALSPAPYSLLPHPLLPLSSPLPCSLDNLFTGQNAVALRTARIIQSLSHGPWGSARIIESRAWGTPQLQAHHPIASPGHAAASAACLNFASRCFSASTSPCSSAAAGAPRASCRCRRC